MPISVHPSSHIKGVLLWHFTASSHYLDRHSRLWDLGMGLWAWAWAWSDMRLRSQRFWESFGTWPLDRRVIRWPRSQYFIASRMVVYRLAATAALNLLPHSIAGSSALAVTIHSITGYSRGLALHCLALGMTYIALLSQLCLSLVLSKPGIVRRHRYGRKRARTMISPIHYSGITSAQNSTTAISAMTMKRLIELVLQLGLSTLMHDLNLRHQH